ncbi:hypothetical protein PGTUg99_011375 [Puccinia graminis f. sp. tritici]|uniref:Uncharacterized protein n=1 Tax=Puccinia graminis f. sp. tritici TaxID=56615 RepID=A0A5B0RTD5_PUCGR|nr:hypothetical protein PGTUg99_011375 [Puccinia graminis f. sp. tritici]
MQKMLRKRIGQKQGGQQEWSPTAPVASPSCSTTPSTFREASPHTAQPFSDQKNHSWRLIIEPHTSKNSPLSSLSATIINGVLPSQTAW